MEFGQPADAHVHGGGAQGEFQKMNARLYFVLVSLTDKGAFAIVDQVENDIAMDALRRLHDSSATARRQTSVAALVAVMGMNLPSGSTLEEKFAKSDLHIDRVETATGDDRPYTANIRI